MNDTYVFPSVFHTEADGISIFFPDLPGCFSCADTMEQAFSRAKEALQLHLYGMEEDGETIPAASPVGKIPLRAGETIAMIEAWMPPFRERMDNRATNKTVTIPRSAPPACAEILSRRRRESILTCAYLRNQ